MLPNLYSFAHVLIIGAFWFCAGLFAMAVGLMVFVKKAKGQGNPEDSEYLGSPEDSEYLGGSNGAEKNWRSKKADSPSKSGAFSQFDFLDIFEKFAVILGIALLNIGIIFVGALIKADPSLKYTALHTATLMPLAYRLAAFWAGAEGSLLFWTIAFAFIAMIFRYLPVYKNLSRPMLIAFWASYFLIVGVFLFLLARWSNPFALQEVALSGGALNQVLQNPIMLIHPPFLLVGYAATGVAAAIALGAIFTRGDILSTSSALRGFMLLAFVFIAAGIALGGFWAFNEPLWGSYWRWDPVENTSLLPALACLAALHALIAQRARPIQEQNPTVANALVMLSFILVLFATYVVRSGVLNSNHAFAKNNSADGFIFLAIFLLAMSVIGIFSQKHQKNAAKITEKEILMFLAVILLLEIVLLIGGATIWPMMSRFFKGYAVSVGVDFYNKTVPPLFILLALLASCSPFSRKVLRRQKIFLGGTLLFVAIFLSLSLVFVLAGVSSIVLAFAASAGLLLFLLPLLDVISLRSNWRSNWNFIWKKPRGKGLSEFWHKLPASMAHMAFALLLVGVGFSSGLKKEFILKLSPHKTVSVNGYNLTLDGVSVGKTADYIFARINVLTTGKSVGSLQPESHVYKNGNTSSVAGYGSSVIFSPLATLVSIETGEKDGDLRFATIKFTENPLLNLVWLGAALLCLAGMLGSVVKFFSPPHV